MYLLVPQPVHQAQGISTCVVAHVTPLPSACPYREQPEILLEYWTGKKDSQKVRTKHDKSIISLFATVVDSEGERCDGHTDSRTDAQCDNHNERQIQEGH